MRPGPNLNNKRPRGGRPNNNDNNYGRNKPHIPPRAQTFDSNGPDVRIRGNAYQVLEKYLQLARDATAAGDRIAAENFYQHAEHYYRVINANAPGGGFDRSQQQPPQQGQQRAPIPGEGEQPQLAPAPQPGQEAFAAAPEYNNAAPDYNNNAGHGGGNSGEPEPQQD